MDDKITTPFCSGDWSALQRLRLPHPVQSVFLAGRLTLVIEHPWTLDVS